MLTSNMSDLPVVKLDKTPNAYFPILPKEIENDLRHTKNIPMECQLQ